MATFYTRPDITLAGLREPESISEMLTRYAQLKYLAERGRYNDLRTKEARLRLQEIERQLRDEASMREATAAGVGRMTAIPAEGLPITGGTMGGTNAFGQTGPTQGPAIPVASETTYNPQSTLARLQQLAPHLVPGAEQGFATQKEAHQKAVLEQAEKLASLDEKQFKNNKDRLETWGSMVNSFLEAPPELRPQIYPKMKADAERLGFIRPGQGPEQYTPEIEPLLRQEANQVVMVKDAFTLAETKRHNREMEKRDTSITPFETWSKQHPNAPVEQWLALQNRYREGGETPAQKLSRQKALNLAEAQKGAALARAEREIRRRYGLTDFAATDAWPQQAIDELQGEKQRIQDEYETKLSTLGADVEHFEYGESRNARQPSRVPSGRGVRLDRNNAEHRRIAAEILAQAGGNKERARQIARQRGYNF